MALRIDGPCLPEGLRPGDYAIVRPGSVAADGGLCVVGASLGPRGDGRPTIGTYSAGEGTVALCDGTRRTLGEGETAWPIVAFHRALAGDASQARGG